MHAVIGRVQIKPGREDETRAMVGEHGVAMLQGMPGATGGYWARTLDGDVIQHSFWLFDDEEHARARGSDLQLVARHARRARDVRERGRVRGHRQHVRRQVATKTCLRNVSGSAR